MTVRPVDYRLCIDPELAVFLPILPETDLTNYVEWRAMLAGSSLRDELADQASMHQAVVVSDRRVPGSPGGPEVPVRVYRPQGDEIRPAFLYFHGGAFVLGEIGLFDSMCENFALGADVVVVSVDYRLSPEDPFPAAIDDAYAVLEWVAGHGADIGANPAAIAVGGLSAGGALAAAVSLMALDRNGPPIALQLLVNAVLDDRLETTSARMFTDTPLWNSRNAAQMWDIYIGPERTEVSPYAAPARATDLSGLPPAYVLTSEFDPLRDEGIAYALRMLEAGVSVELHNFVGTFHSFDAFPTAVSSEAVAEQHAALRRALHTA
jgi:acetyl esterase/lipase